MPAFVVILVNIVSVAFVIAGIVRSGERTQVLLYAFILDYSFRLLTIDAITRVLRKKPGGHLALVVSLVCSPPAHGQRSHPITQQARPAGVGSYVAVMTSSRFSRSCSAT